MTDEKKEEEEEELVGLVITITDHRSVTEIAKVEVTDLITYRILVAITLVYWH